MKVRVTFDINKARLIHLDWVMRIEKRLDAGRDAAPCLLPYYQDCELGVWLHGEGRTKYRQYEDIQRLAIEHRRFHHAVDHMLLALHEGNLARVRELLNGVLHMSKDIIHLLTLLELKTLEKLRMRQLGGGIFAAIESFFPSTVNWLEPPKAAKASASIDITYARLAHLHWATKLDHRFRNYGQGVFLQSHDTCDFGTWIHRVGVKKYADIEEMHLLEATHGKFHDAAARIIRNLQNRQLRRADEAYVDVQNYSREIAWLLTVIEYRLAPRQPSGDASASDRGAGPPARDAEATAEAPVAQLSPMLAAAEHLLGR